MAKRGRPKKINPIPSLQPPAPKKRGRPRKIHSSPTPPTAPTRKRGRPRLAATPSEGGSHLAVTSSEGGLRKTDTVGKLKKPTVSSRTAEGEVTTPAIRDLSPASPLSPLSSQSSNTFKIPRLPHRSPDTLDKVWDNALTLAGTITDHYAMRRNEQKEALKFALEELNQGDLFVELGMGHGHTASIISYGAKLLGYRYIGIDNFTVEAKEATTRENLNRLHLPFELIVGDSRTLRYQQPIDILLIDASHDVVAVNEDTQMWLPRLRPGGLVMYHDYSKTLTPSDPHWGIKFAADTFTGNWKTESLIDWLLVRRKPLR